jgi:signal transduction histidine kinase
MYLAISIVLSFFLLALGLAVFIRSGKRSENILFSLLSLLSSIWMLLYALIDYPKNIIYVDWLNRATYGVGIATLFCATAFTFYYPVKMNLKPLKIYFLFCVSVFLLSFTRYVSGVPYFKDGEIIYTYGSLIAYYVFVSVLGTVFITKNLLIRGRQEGSDHGRASRLILGGYLAAIFSAIFTAVVLPGFFNNSRITSLAPVSIIFLISATFIAMKSYKLFDMRGAIAVAFAYVVSTLAFALLYVSAIVLMQLIIIQNDNINISDYSVSVVTATVLVLFYPSFKKRFDRFTNQIFFRDSYDPQSFIGNLNQLLVTKVELQSLLDDTAKLIESNMKSISCSFYIRETSYFPQRYYGATDFTVEGTDMNSAQELTSKLHKKVHSTEEENDEIETALNKLLKKNGVEVIARLVSTLEYELKGIGYILLAPKKSGVIYSRQDLKILEIIANELVIAAENILRFEEIEQFNVTLQKKIDEATKELQTSNDKLKALDEAKDEFVSMASHQLRTPLTSVKGYISMVLEGDAGKINDTQKQMLGQALFSSQRMVYLISDLLNVSRLKTGKFVIEPKPIFLPDLVESEMSQLYEGATAKNITLQYAKPKKFTTVNLDEMKIRQVVMNFTDNAIYYTPNGGKITVELKDKKDSIEFTVKDTGIGVPKAERHKLFEKFYRAENARKARPDGTGLGLFMAKKVIVAQGGSILFDSKEGKGSTFGFSFPKKVITDDTQVHNQSGTPESNQSPEKA